MAEENVSMDEIIINIVRDNKVIYDKADVNYKKIDKRKDVWKMISLHLKEFYNVDMSAENIEKRWTALRDMFCREQRRKKLPRSGLRSIPGNEWHLYQPLHFLSAHIAHRKPQRALKRKLAEDLISESSLTFRKIAPLVDCKATMKEKISQEMQALPVISDAYIGPCIIDKNVQSHPMGDPASLKNNKDANLREQLVDVCATISSTMTSMSTLITSTINKYKEKDGYILAIDEGLKHVPGKCKTQCIIEVLQIIKKYEIRE